MYNKTETIPREDYKVGITHGVVPSGVERGNPELERGITIVVAEDTSTAGAL